MHKVRSTMVEYLRNHEHASISDVACYISKVHRIKITEQAVAALWSILIGGRNHKDQKIFSNREIEQLELDHIRIKRTQQVLRPTEYTTIMWNTNREELYYVI